MILLLGGTSETAPLATALAEAGYRVLVSTATDVPLDVGSHPQILRRSGKLDRQEMCQLVKDRGVRLIVDASHPYAAEASSTARSVTEELGLPCLRWLRPSAVHADDVVHLAADHTHAAALACSFGKPILLTIGTRNLAPYATEARLRRVTVVARVLPHEDSLAAAAKAGIAPELTVVGRGPFSLEENLSTIIRFGIGCLVTKDSGEAGGVPAKIEAARLARCQVVVVERPKDPAGASFSDVSELVAAVRARLR